MYPGSGGFSPAVRNLSSGALDYWIECNLASCIEFIYPGSAGLIATPVEPNPSSVALDYCNKIISRKSGNVKGNFQKTLIRQLKLGLEGLASCDLCLGSGGLRSWPGKLRPLFGFWGLEVVAWQAATSVWASEGIGVVAWQAGASGSSPGKLRPFFGFWGLDIVAWQAATSVWVLGQQIEIWPDQSQLLSGQSRMLCLDGSRTTWPVVLPLSWLHRRKQSAKLFA
ncbi:hypothetical protein B0H14DRAFT_3124191 [Mycena olivaceomarginata]|nr:hypothetical protein B0H14DRAFT_3124191 [Mycena olivaceomarginata]